MRIRKRWCKGAACSQSEVSQELAVRAISIDGETKQAVEAALQRLDGGKYGICDSCGKLIDLKRVRAIPWVTLCVPCLTKEGESCTHHA